MRENETHILLGPPFHRHWRGAAGYSIKAYAGGDVLFRIGRQWCRIGDEALVLVNAGQEYEFQTPADSGLFNFTIFLSDADLEDCWASLGRSELALLDDPVTKGAGLPEFFVTPLRPSPAEQEIRRRLRELAESHTLGAAERTEATAELIALALRAQCHAQGQVRRVRATRQSTREEAVRRVRRAIDACEADISKSFSLEDMAAIACMEKHHFLRRFKSVTGETPYQFLLGRRFARARDLLLTSDIAVAEVAQRCGFADPATFSVAFSRRHGLPPRAWRRLQAAAAAKPSA